MTKEELRFWNFVRKTDTCWIWIGPIMSSGYGMLNRKLAHRTVFKMVGLKAPSSFEDVHHKCHNRLCVNPEHLEITDYKHRGEFWKNKMFCSKGHPFNEQNTYFYKGHRKCKICMRTITKSRRELGL